MKNKTKLIIIITISFLSVTGIAFWFLKQPKTVAKLAENQAITDVGFNTVYSSIKKYTGTKVKWGGRVFTEPEKDGSTIYFQMFEGDDADHNVMVSAPDFNGELKEDDYIVLEGTIGGLWKGKNSFNADIDAMKIIASKIEAGSKSKVLAPADKIVPINDTKDVSGFMITLDRIEIAEKETRVYLKVKNGTSEEVSFYTYGAKLVQGTTQLESQTGDTDEELPSSIAPNVEAVGAVFFDKVSDNPKEISIFINRPYVNGSYGDYSDLEFKVILP